MWVQWKFPKKRKSKNSLPNTLPPTNMEVRKGPFQEESRLSTGSVHQSMLAGGRVASWRDERDPRPLQNEALGLAFPLKSPELGADWIGHSPPSPSNYPFPNSREKMGTENFQAKWEATRAFFKPSGTHSFPSVLT